MISPRKYQIVQRALLLSGLFGLLYYQLVFRPLADRVNGLDQPLQEVWSRLFKKRLTNAGGEDVDIESMRRIMERLTTTLNNSTNFNTAVMEHIRTDGVVRLKMRQSFQLVEFSNERQLLQEELASQARSNKVSIAAAVTAGYPEYSADLLQPGLLWAQLSIMHQTLLTAINSGIGSIESVSARPSKGLRMEDDSPPIADELSFNLQMTGEPLAVGRFLACLPIRKPEAIEANLPAFPESKPELFIDRLVIRREVPEKPDVVRMELRISALVYRD
jgi:hypothetical protein